MSSTAAIAETMAEFLRGWQEDAGGVKPACEALFAHITSLKGLKPALLYRPGISLSVRALAEDDPERIIALLDIIDDDPAARWLSLCFDAACVRGAEGRGDMVPQGLQGRDALCFDYDADDPALLAYLQARLSEAALR